jgi:hypothetical protein
MAKQELTALRNVIEQADHILATTPPLPDNRTAAYREFLQTAVMEAGITDHVWTLREMLTNE